MGLSEKFRKTELDKYVASCVIVFMITFIDLTQFIMGKIVIAAVKNRQLQYWTKNCIQTQEIK